MSNFNNKLFVRFLEETIPGSKGAWGTRSTPQQKKIARKIWHKWVAIRQYKGVCISCNRKHRPDEQRCGLHRNINKAKCLAWARANKKAIRQQYKDRVEAGVCVSNPKHGQTDGYTQCLTCRKRNRKRNQRK